MELLQWLGSNYRELAQILMLIVLAGEIVTRLTPTKTDDGFMRRIGSGMDRLLDALRIPNVRRQIESDDVGPD